MLGLSKTNMLQCSARLQPFQHVPSPLAARPRSVVARAMDPGMMEQMKKMMSDPAMAERMKQMQEAMQRPEMQQQMAQMQAMLQNEELRKRMAALREDPELKPMFDEIQKGGMGAYMKMMNDPTFLAKVGAKLGDLPLQAMAQAPPQQPGAAAAAAMAPPPPPPEINDLIDAAKYGDAEAVEDFIAVGKDVNMTDKEGRTPLHFACGVGQVAIVKMLVEAGAALEAVDAMANTPLHYAAGYGRAPVVAALLEAGASGKAKNQNGKTPADLVTMEPRNPLNGDAEMVKRLAAAAAA